MGVGLSAFVRSTYIMNAYPHKAIHRQSWYNNTHKAMAIQNAHRPISRARKRMESVPIMEPITTQYEFLTTPYSFKKEREEGWWGVGGWVEARIF